MAPTSSTNSQQEKMKRNSTLEYQQIPPPPLPFSFLRELFTPLRNGECQYQPPVATSQACITLDQVRNGLEKNNNNPPVINVPGSSSSSSLYDLAEDLKAQLKSHDEELDQLILAHGEQLKRKLAERDRDQYRSLVRAAEATASKKLREKEASLDSAVRHAGELQVQLEKSRREATALSAQSADKNQIILSLHSQLRRAEAALARSGARRGGEGCGETAAVDDAESGCSVDPERRRIFGGGACRECGERAAEVVVLPCRHLCLCAECNGNVAPLPCPVCHRVRNGYMQVFMD